MVTKERAMKRKHYDCYLGNENKDLRTLEREHIAYGLLAGADMIGVSVETLKSLAREGKAKLWRLKASLVVTRAELERIVTEAKPYVPPDVVASRARKPLEVSDVPLFDEFLVARAKLTPKSRVGARQLYRAWRSWVVRQPPYNRIVGVDGASFHAPEQMFSRWLRAFQSHRFRRARYPTGVIYEGLELLPEVESIEPEAEPKEST